MSDSYTPTENNDLLATTGGDDIVNAQGGDDTIAGSAGNDILDGGTGVDQVDYSGNSGDYSFSTGADGSIQVTKPDGSVDTLRNIDGIWFAGDQAWRSIDELVQTAENATDGATTDTATNDTDGAAQNQVDYEGNSADYWFTQNADGSVQVTKPDGTTETLQNITGVWFAGDQVWRAMDDLLEAGAGSDTTTGSTETTPTQIDYEGNSTDYWFEQNADGSIKVTKPDGTVDTLTDIQSVWFAGDEVWSFIADILENQTDNTTTGNTDAAPTQVDYEGNSTDYWFEQNADGSIKVTKPDGTVDTLTDIQSVWFAGDQVWSFIADILENQPDNTTTDTTDTAPTQVDYEGNSTDYWFEQNADGSINVTKPDGTVDTLTDIQSVWFAGDEVWSFIADILENQPDNTTTGNTDAAPTQVDYEGNSTDYWFEQNADGSIKVTKPDGTVDTLTDIQSVWFAGDEVWSFIADILENQTDNTATDTAVNTAPVAGDDWVNLTSGEQTTVNVLGNDSDADGDGFYISAINGTPMQPGWSTWIEGVGEVSLNADGTLGIESAVEGNFSFQYTIIDANGGTSTATVEGTSAAPVPEGTAPANTTHTDMTPAAPAPVAPAPVTPAPTGTAPTANNDWVALTSGETQTITVLANDTDDEFDSVYVSAINGTPMQPGWKTWVEGVGLVTVVSKCTLSIESAVEGNFSFEYTITDADGQSSTATVEGTSEAPAPANAAPVATNDFIAVTSGEPTTVNVLGNDSDAEGDGFYVSAINGTPMQPGWSTWIEGVGEVSLHPDGSLCIESAVEGNFSFEYTITDANGGTSTATVNGTSEASAPDDTAPTGTNTADPAPIGTAPTANDDWVALTSGETQTITVMANDTDDAIESAYVSAINGIPMQIGWKTWVEGVGLVTVVAGCTLSIESAVEGNFSFEYTITDADGQTSTATVEGTSAAPAPANAAPVAINDFIAVTSGEPTTVNVLGNDSDAEGDGFYVSAINGTPMQPGWSTWIEGVGEVSLHPDGSLCIESAVEGDFSFQYTITDANGGTSTATVNGTSEAPAPSNAAPVAVNDFIAVTSGEPTTVNVLGNDSDAEGDGFHVSAINGTPMQPGWSTWIEGVGEVSLHPDGSLCIESAVEGDFSFEYTITDANGGTSTATVNGTSEAPAPVGPTPVGPAPIALDDALTGTLGEAITISPLNNDSDVDGDVLTIVEIHGTAMQAGWVTWVNDVGLVTLNADNTITLQPANGVDHVDFTYTISDGNGNQTMANITGTLEDIPNTTHAANDAISSEYNTPISIDVLGNDVDAEADAFSITGFGNGTNGTVSQGQNGQLIYTPTDGFSGTDTFTYTITDANGATDTATVCVDVQAPVIPNTTDAVDDAAWAEFNTPVTINVLGNDVDAEADTFSITGFGNGANGTVSQGQNGQLIYTPADGFSGTDTFTYTITDANGATDTATVTVDVQAQVIPNTTDAVDDASSTEFNTPVSINVLGNDVDAEADTFTVTGFGNGANGTVSQGQNGQLIYTPADGFSGTDTFTYTITDANGATDTATVTVDVQEQVIPNTTDAVDDAAWAEFNTPVTIDVLGNDVDAEADTFSITGFGNGANGTVSQGQNGQLIYTPADGFSGTDTFTYTITDANGATDTATVSVDVQPPVANSSIGNQVFLDSNQNGVQDAGEAGVADVTVNLKDATGAVIDTQKTDANGNYLFDDLVAGDYSVGVDAPDNFALTEQNAGTDDAADSDINVTTGMSDTVTLGEDEQNLTVDAGLVDMSTDLEADAVKVCEDDAGTFNVLDNDTGKDLRLVGVTHETPELQAEFEARGGELTFDADGNVTYTGMTDYYGNDVLIYTVEDASGEQFTQTVDIDVEATSDAGQVDVTEDYQRGVSGYRDDKNYQYHFTHRVTAERMVIPHYFEPFFNDDKDALQQFSDYNTDVADDRDTIAFIELFDAEDNGSTWRLNGVEIDPVNEIVRVPWSDIITGQLTLQLPKPWTEQTFNFHVVDTGGEVSGQKGANVSSSDFLTTWTPVALDLSGDGKIGVTGETSSHQKDPDAEIGDTVQFDIDADGDLDTIEWYDGSGDGILVDTSKIGEDGSIDGSALFGDENGQYADGYEKLKTFDKDGDGQLSGDELNNIGVWIDDGDAVLEEGELVSAAEQGIASVSTEMDIVLDDEGRELLQSTATTLDGQTILTEDVWFAEGDMESFAEFDAHDMNDMEVDQDDVA